MAFPSFLSLQKSAAICILVFLVFAPCGDATRCYESIISFGDSLADTGNLIRMWNPYNIAAVLPYGETFFHRPTGRFSDGRLILDFIAQSLGLPFLRPYLSAEEESDFQKGVNFAVAGATALNISFFHERGIYNAMTNTSLGTQLDWFHESFCTNIHSADCKEKLQSSLVMMGEIGGNDYNYAFLQGIPREEISSSFVPEVISTISSAITKLIEFGARSVVVPGNLPIGCSPVYLFYFKSSKQSEYNSTTGCINWLNEFSMYHNEQLKLELSRLRELHHNTTIIYADYYNAAMDLYTSPSNYGFNNTLSACCGQCMFPNPTVCDEPSSFVNWDGIHLTEAAYEAIAQGLLHGPYTSPHVYEFCILKGSRGAQTSSDHLRMNI
ncbi:PREDICTED: GDSL esterase/lipase At1g28580-like [Ipomoea nil]|uniref:GDSL esterase/lipase At1g28580-like n=1 Tax=Ipomoea nil TaxID=35883 RepID=UPI000901F060|nr:PREDICTED: GDSL esterase/lipase At1g28580-like [Ipomoea nil]